MKRGGGAGHERGNTDSDQSLHYSFESVYSLDQLPISFYHWNKKSVISTWQRLPQASRGKKKRTSGI